MAVLDGDRWILNIELDRGRDENILPIFTPIERRSVFLSGRETMAGHGQNDRFLISCHGVCSGTIPAFADIATRHRTEKRRLSSLGETPDSLSL